MKSSSFVIRGALLITFSVCLAILVARHLPLSLRESELRFADVTGDAGIDFVHDAGDLNSYWLPQINGSGLAVFDFDNDGRPDLYFLNLSDESSRSVNHLYQNMGAGRFKDVTAGSGLGIGGLGKRVDRTRRTEHDPYLIAGLTSRFDIYIVFSYACRHEFTIKIDVDPAVIGVVIDSQR